MFTPLQLIEPESPAGRPVVYYHAPPYATAAVVTFSHWVRASHFMY